MTVEERQKMKEKIREEIEELRGRMPSLKEEAKPVPPDGAVGRLSRMDAIAQQGVRDAAYREAKARLEKLEIRLKKTDDADFGNCSVCRQPIAPARLLFLPESDRCVGCAG